MIILLSLFLNIKAPSRLHTCYEEGWRILRWLGLFSNSHRGLFDSLFSLLVFTIGRWFKFGGKKPIFKRVRVYFWSKLVCCPPARDALGSCCFCWPLVLSQAAVSRQRRFVFVYSIINDFFKHKQAWFVRLKPIFLHHQVRGFWCIFSNSTQGLPILRLGHLWNLSFPGRNCHWLAYSSLIERLIVLPPSSPPGSKVPGLKV